MNLSILKNHLILLGFLAIFVPISAQQSIIEKSDYTNFRDALKLYNSKAYAAAQKEFKEVLSTYSKNNSLYSDAKYYEAICAIKLNQVDAEEKILSFVDNYSTSPKKNAAFLKVGNYYFENKNLSKALKWFKKVDINQLTKAETKTFNFNMAYTLLASKKYEEAKQKYYSLLNDKKYGNDSRYYYGFIAYKLEDYELAEETLSKVASDGNYDSKISYYLLDIYFKSGKFDESIALGKTMIKSANRLEKSEISKIIGESYFNSKEYEKAIPYLKDYRGKRGKLTNTDYYQLGYAYFKMDNPKNAISYFNKIIGKRNEVAQNAYYHLAQCYLALDLKNEALNAFKVASVMDFDAKIQEDAALNYAKLSYEEGNPFENVSDVLQNFLENYPNSNAYDEINDLIVSSFLAQEDYEGALSYLASNKSAKNKKLGREISLYRGLQLFNENKFKEASTYLSNAENAEESSIRNRATYWKAESYFRVDNFSDALQEFIQLERFNSARRQFRELNYNIAYCYFNLIDYTNAKRFFIKYINQNPDEDSFLNDSYLRLADSYYALAQYNEAKNYYIKVVKNQANGADYAQYQIGMSEGFVNEDEKKIAALNKVVNNFKVSNLKDDALYQLAGTYTKLKNNISAHSAYDRLLQDYPRSSFVPRALLRQGLLYYNENNNDKALQKFKLTASKFPNSSDAIEAVRNAKNIYIDEDNLDEYVQWTKQLNFVSISESEVERTAFSIAEQKYFEGKNSNSITSLEKYLANYPNSANSVKARYYLAEAQFKTGDFENAEKNYLQVNEAGETEYKENVISKLSQILLQNNEFKEALPYLEELNKIAYEPDNILFAQSNLMNVYYQTKAYSKAKDFAERILLNSEIDNELKLDAEKIIARTSFQENNFEKAKEYFSIIQEKATGELKAEALYYNAYFENKAKNFEDSNKIVQDLIADYSNYKYWGVKSYLIMAQNYYELEDAYQATFILENVIKNFGQYKDVITEAESILKKIKAEEAKTNNSITPEKKN